MAKKARPYLFIGGALMVGIAAFAQSLLAQQGLPPQNARSIPSQQQPNAMPSLKAPLPQPQSSLEVPSLKLRNQPGYQQVTVTVTDSSGKYVTDLKEDDFRVIEDGEQRPIEFFRVDRSAPFSLGVVVDCSSSMDTKMGQARTAIAQMIDQLDSRDEIFLESFSDEAQLLQPFTVDHSKIIYHLDFLHPLTHTALYDAVFMGLYEMHNARRDKRALLVITDGMDTWSKMSREEVITVARAMKVLIYSIGIGANTTLSDADQVDMPTLKALSNETGGAAFNLPRIGDGADLSRYCTAISNELTRQYTIAYLSPDPGRPGYRPLRVEIPKHPELSARVRKGIAIVPH